MSDAMTPKKLTIAFLSDLHVFEATKDMKPDNEPSFLSTGTPEILYQNPMTDLFHLISEEALSADILICGGDITDKASQAGQIYAWKRINELGAALGTQHVWATTGNHDMNSRGHYDAKGGLMALQPYFPGYDEQKCDRYWARNFILESFGGCRFLNVNSCAFHGYGGNTPEYDHGRVSDHTLSAIREELTQSPWVGPNIAFFHHHPYPHNPNDDPQYSAMTGGHELMNLLSDGSLGSRWLVMHGHKHYPKIDYAQGGNRGPVIFSAGSFSSKDLAKEAGANSFYMFDIMLEPEVFNLPLAGCGQCWEWHVRKGWNSSRNDKLPYKFGFGHQPHSQAAAKQIAEIFAQTGEPILSWEQVVAKDPCLNFILPEDLKAVFRELDVKNNIEVLYDSDRNVHKLAVKS